MTEPLVVMDGINKHFGDLHVLKDIDLTVGKGEVVILIGPSGSGKSTLCRTINRLETYEAGSITIDGKTLPEEGKDLAALRADLKALVGAEDGVKGMKVGGVRELTVPASLAPKGLQAQLEAAGRPLIYTVEVTEGAR